MKRLSRRACLIAILALVSCSQHPAAFSVDPLSDDLFGARQCYLLENREDTFSESIYFQLLEGEYLGKHDNPSAALDYYVRAASQSRDIFILARATVIARYVSNHDQVIALTRQWMEIEPLCPQPYEFAMEAYLLEREVERAMDVFSTAAIKGVRINMGAGLSQKRNLNEAETQRYIAKLIELDEQHPEALQRSVDVTKAQYAVLELRPKDERNVYKIRSHQTTLIDYPVAEITQFYDILTHIEERALNGRPPADYIKAAIAAMYVDNGLPIPEERILFDEQAPHEIYHRHLAAAMTELMTANPNTPLRNVITAGTQGVVSSLDSRSAYREKLTVLTLMDRSTARIPKEAVSLLEGGTIVVTVNTFSDGAAARIREAINQALSTDDVRTGDIKHLIVDLRGSKGGTLMAAVAISDLFLDSGQVVVETRGRHEGANEIFRTENPPSFRARYITVLVDENTVGSAEILAHALRHYLKARLVGTPTYGLHTVRTQFPLRSGDSILLTTAEYVGPGEQHFAQGLLPDHCYTHQENTSTTEACDRQDLKDVPVEALLSTGQSI